MQPGPTEPTRMEQGRHETIVEVARVPETSHVRGAPVAEPARSRPTRYALIAHAPERGRGRYALEFLGADGTLLEVSFHADRGEARARARELAGELGWRDCGIEVRSAARVEPHLFTRFLED